MKLKISVSILVLLIFVSCKKDKTPKPNPLEGKIKSIDVQIDYSSSPSEYGTFKFEYENGKLNSVISNYGREYIHIFTNQGNKVLFYYDFGALDSIYTRNKFWQAVYLDASGNIYKVTEIDSLGNFKKDLITIYGNIDSAKIKSHPGILSDIDFSNYEIESGNIKSYQNSQIITLDFINFFRFDRVDSLFYSTFQNNGMMPLQHPFLNDGNYSYNNLLMLDPFYILGLGGYPTPFSNQNLLKEVKFQDIILETITYITDSNKKIKSMKTDASESGGAIINYSFEYY